MSDLRTMRYRIRQDLQEPNIVDSTREEYNQAMLAIRDAIEELKHEEFWFNTRGPHSFATVNGQETYAISEDDSELPADLIAIIGDDNIYMEFNQSSTNIRTLKRVTAELYDEMSASFTTSSDPLYWRFFNQLLWLLPVPASTVHNVKFRYLVDLGVPVARLNASNAWEFEPDTWGGALCEQAWQEDNSGGSYIDQTDDINDEGLADVSPWPNGAGEDDAFYLGYARRPTSLVIKTSTAGAGTHTVTWEYWNGTAWTALAGVTDGSSGFQTAGRTRLTFTDPATAWRKTVVNSSSLLYFLRARRDAGTVTTDPILSQVEAEGNASPWLNEAERVVRFRAEYALCIGYLKDPERGQMYLQRALEAQQDLQQRQMDMHRLHQVEGYI